MAAVDQEETEYESDPEEAKLSLAMRRREASDDEEGEGEEREKREEIRRIKVDSDADSDGQGGAAVYDDDESEVGEEEEYEEEEAEEEAEEEEEQEEEEAEELDEEEGFPERDGERGVQEVAGVQAASPVQEPDRDGRRLTGESLEGQDENQVEEEKKENEPFAVPTAGAFYMHDDRFREAAGGRHRRTPGGRKLWESKDDRKWGHDKFEEMTQQDRHYEEGRRRSKGHFHSRGKSRGTDRGYPRGNRIKTYNNNYNQNHAPPKAVRGRGPRRYQPPTRNKNEIPPHSKQSRKSFEKTSNMSSGRAYVPVSTVEPDSVPAKQVFSSSLNYASPPFYPSGSSNKDVNPTPKKEIATGVANRNLRPSVSNENISVTQSNTLLRGKNIADNSAVSMEQLYIGDSTSTQPKAQGRGLPLSGQMAAYQPIMQPHGQLQQIQRSPVQTRAQPSSGSQASSPPKTALSINSLDSGELESSSESSKSKTALVGKGKGTGVQGGGRGSFLYGGAQVMGSAGNMGVGQGDQNFPAFLPVMQFGGQHPGGIGVPAVGMAFPGYVAQPQLGLGNSEMTWLPVLAGAAGALGATYCSSYMAAADNAYPPRQSGQASSLGSSSKDNSTSNKLDNAWKPSQRPESVTDEYGQRQNKPRRYSEMSFGQ